MRRTAATWLCLLLASWLPAAAGATPTPSAGPGNLLNLPLEFPLLAFNNTGTLDYDAATDLLAVDAEPVALRLAPATKPRGVRLPRDFTLRAEIDDTGALVGGIPGDDLRVRGTVELGAGFGNTTVSGVLLTGEVRDFGFQEAGPSDLFEFEVVNTGGLLSGLFASTLTVFLTSEGSSFTNSFRVDFGGGAKGTLGSVPEPRAMLLLALGLIGLAAIGRRRS